MTVPHEEERVSTLLQHFRREYNPEGGHNQYELELEGHLMDEGMLTRTLDLITEQIGRAHV